jgi:hypothetical protein
MKRQELALALALAVLSHSAAARAQTGADRAKPEAAARASNRSEPLRVVNGEMVGPKVTGQIKNGRRLTDFSFRLTKAEIVNGRLLLNGDFALDAGSLNFNDKVTATIAGTMTKVSNPWPQAADQPRKEDRKSQAAEQAPGREVRSPEATGQLGQLAQATESTARKTPALPGERNEQSASLQAQAEATSGCGVMFLSLTLPPRLRARMGAGTGPIQLGVVLAPFDNRTGEAISRQICQIIRPPDGKSDGYNPSASLQQLNQLLGSSR